MLAKGPWLVLDSLLSRERGRADEVILLGTLLEPRDTLERTLGYWARVAPDSIIFNERSTFPSVTWRFRQSADELRGIGVLLHDLVSVGSDGVERRMVSRWPVRLVRIPCADISR